MIAGISLDMGFDQGVSTAVISYQSAAMLLVCGLFAVVNRYISSRCVILIGSLTFLVIPLLLISNASQFLLLFAVVYFGKTLVDYAVPSLLRIVVPVEIAGPYNAWRMNIHTIGILLATTLAALIPVWLLLVLTMLGQVISGLCYFTMRVPETDPAGERSRRSHEYGINN